MDLDGLRVNGVVLEALNMEYGLGLECLRARKGEKIGI